MVCVARCGRAIIALSMCSFENVKTFALSSDSLAFAISSTGNNSGALLPDHLRLLLMILHHYIDA